MVNFSFNRSILDLFEIDSNRFVDTFFMSKEENCFTFDSIRGNLDKSTASLLIHKLNDETRLLEYDMSHSLSYS